MKMIDVMLMVSTPKLAATATCEQSRVARAEGVPGEIILF